jgi:WD40 repeat protein
VTVTDPFARRQVLVFRDLARGCSCLALGPGGHLLAAACKDGSVHVWDATPVNGTEDHRLHALDYPGELWGFAITENGRSIAVAGLQPLDASAGKGAEVLVWSSPGFSKPVPLPGYSIVVFSLDYDRTGRLLAFSGDEEGRARLKVLDLESGREAYPVEAFEGDQVLFSVAFSPDRRWLVGGGRDCKIKVWDGASGRKVGKLGEHADQITKLAFSPDGKYLASIGADDIVKVWDATRLDKAQVPLLKFDGQCDDYSDLIAFSSDSTRLAVVTDDNTVKIHDIRSGDVGGGEGPVLLISRGHQPLALAISPDGRWVATGGRDGAVKVWDAQTTHLLKTFKGHKDQVTRLKFFQRAEGLCLASGSRDSTVMLWDLAPVK